MDVLSDVLDAVELKGWLAMSREAVAPWRVDFAASRDSNVHILSCDGAYLCVDGDPAPLRVEDGDVLLFPSGHAHTLCDDLVSPLLQTVRLTYDAQHEYQFFPVEGEGPRAVITCGAFRFEHPGTYPLRQLLPKVIHIPGEQGRLAPGFADIVRAIAREAAAPRAGTDAMLRRLTEMLFIQVIRVWIDQQAPTSGGWLAALRDPAISTALGLIHRAPERGWTVAELAEAVALSRSAFSARFSQLVGEPPIKYLARWRMQKAARMLKNDAPVEQVAQRLGYESGVAFRKAFKREVGTPPARYRRQG